MLKRIMLMLALTAGLTSCGGGDSALKETVGAPAGDVVEVIYFHGKKRCATCMAIEQNTVAVIDSVFADEVKSGSVVFRIVDISSAEGEALADRYEVTWSSLFVNRWRDGMEQRNNLTDFGFGNARKSPERFRQGLADQIRKSLE